MAGRGLNDVSLDNVTMQIPTTLPMNGNFEYSSIGTSRVITNAAIDTTTFLGWRLFRSGQPPINGFTGTIVNAGSYVGGTPGSHAMRLDINNTS